MKGNFLFLFFIAVLLLPLIAVPVLAGDVPESALLYADGCFIGTVQQVDGAQTTIKIKEVVFGTFYGETAEISGFEYWAAPGAKSTPKKGDYCAVVVKQSDSGYKVYEGLAAKADSLDKKTLKLKSSLEFIKRMNTYINNGWYSNDTIDNINEKRGRKEKSTPEASAVDFKTDTAAVPPAAGENISTTAPAASAPSSALRQNIPVLAGLILVLIVAFIVLIKHRASRRPKNE